MMSGKPATAERHEVTLIRLGVGRREYALPEGATLADLLREAQATGSELNMTIDGRPIEDHIVLQPGMVVTITPSVKGVGPRGSWRDTIGMFADDPTFGEMVEAGRAIREEERRVAREELESDVS